MLRILDFILKANNLSKKNNKIRFVVKKKITGEWFKRNKCVEEKRPAGRMLQVKGKCYSKTKFLR